MSMRFGLQIFSNQVRFTSYYFKEHAKNVLKGFWSFWLRSTCAKKFYDTGFVLMYILFIKKYEPNHVILEVSLDHVFDLKSLINWFRFFENPFGFRSL